MDNKTVSFMSQLFQTVRHSNNGYQGSGKINLYQKNLITGYNNFDNAFSRRDPVKLIKYINLNSENWYTANSVSSQSRSKAKVVGFNMLFCDIDSIGLAKVSPSETYQKVLDCINDDLILTPTAILRSGHGIHLLYLLKNQVPNRNAKIARYWQKTEIANLKLISKYVQGVDWKVKDANRILRMPSSNNTKDYAQTGDHRDLKRAEILKLTNVKYDFWTLCEEMVEKPEHLKHKTEYQAWKRRNEYQNSLNTHKKLKLVSHKKLDTTSLNLAHRIKDVIRLIGLRHGHMDHYRNIALHIIGSGWLYVNRKARYASQDTQREIKKYTWNLIKKVNGLFIVPKRASVMKRFHARIMASKFDISHKHNDFGKYCYSKKGMLNVLDIKPSEQWELSYLRSSKVESEHLAYTRKLNRYNERTARQVASFQKRVQRLKKVIKLVHKMLKYRKNGYTYKQISKVFNCSISHAYRLICKYQYLAKNYGSHKFNDDIQYLTDLLENKIINSGVVKVSDNMIDTMNKIRGSA